MPTLFLRTETQVALFSLEIAGQISDGHWENSGPRDHWRDWCSCQVATAGDLQPGRNFHAVRDRYGLTSPRLLEVVGGRMIEQARLTIGLGLEAARDLETFLPCLDDYAVGPIEVPGPDLAGPYWDEKRAVLKRYDVELVNRTIAASTYGKRELLADLREIQAAMQNLVPHKDPSPVKKRPERFYGHDRLASAVALKTGLKAVVVDSPTPYEAWYDLVTQAGMRVTDIQLCRTGQDGEWTVEGHSLPWLDEQAWKAVQRVGREEG